MTTARTILVWWAATVALLAAVGVTWDACDRHRQRRDVARFKRERLERQERYAATHMADQMRAARRRHPTAYLRPVQSAMPADQVDRLLYELEVRDTFRADIAKLRDVDE